MEGDGGSVKAHHDSPRQAQTGVTVVAEIVADGERRDSRFQVGRLR